MASRKEQKEAARAARLQAEQARQAQQQRQRRLQTLAGAVVAAVVVIAVLIAISSGGGGGGSSSKGLKNGSQASSTVQAVNSLLAGIPQKGNTLGNPRAPVTMTYFGDLQCPVCRDFTLSGGFPQLVQRDVRQGKVKVVYRAFETATQNPSTFQTQQTAALAAGKQNHFWDFAELFYRQQGQEGSNYVTESFLNGLARQVSGLNLTRWSTDRSNQALAAQVASDAQAGRTAGVQGTPTLIFTGPKGQSIAPQGVPAYSDLQQAIKQVA